MDTKKLENSIEELLLPVVESMGFELVDVRLISGPGRRILQILADRQGGITLDECVRLSRELSPHLEVADVIPGAYNLEVSSPGIRRPLKKHADFSRFVNQPVVVATSAAVDGRKRFKGENLGLDEDGRIQIKTDEGIVALDWENVDKARLDPEIPFGPKSGG